MNPNCPHKAPEHNTLSIDLDARLSIVIRAETTLNASSNSFQALAMASRAVVIAFLLNRSLTRSSGTPFFWVVILSG
jgi:hypothetical protein